MPPWQLALLARKAHQREQSVGDVVGGRLVAGKEKQDAGGDKLVLETCAKGLVLKPGKAQEFNAAGSSLTLRFEPGTGDAEGFVYWSPGLRGLPFKRIKESFE